MRKKLLVVSQRYWPEETRINDMIPVFTRKGCKVDVLCGQPNYPRGEFFEGYSFNGVREEIQDGVHIYRAGETRRGPGSAVGIFLNYISFPLFSMRRVPELKKNKYDRIFVYQTSPVMQARAAVRMAKETGTEMVIYIKDLWPESIYRELDVMSPLMKKFYRHLSRKYYFAAKRLIVISEKTKKYLVSELDIPEARITYIPQIPDPVYAESAENAGLMERYAGSFNMVYVAQTAKGRDFETLIRAVGQLVNMGRRDMRLIIACEEELGGLDAVIDDEGVRDYVFVERIKKHADIAGYVHLADVLCDSLTMEATDDYQVPDTLVSYMSAGKPVLIAAGGDVRSLVRQTKCGIISEPGDYINLSTAMQRMLIMSREDRMAMGTSGFKFARTVYGHDKNIARVHNIIFAEEE